MNIKTILVVLILGFVSLSNAKDPAEKHRKSFAKLNKYLEKKVKSDDPVLNRVALRKLLDGKSSGFKFLTSFYMDTLKKLIDFTELDEERIVCKVIRSTKLAEELDSGLADESREKTPNYPLTRIDKILQHFTFINTKYCQFYHRVPTLKFGFKQLAYDQINNMLIDGLPNNDDIEANIGKAEELLKTLEPKDGALADALKQFLELKLTLNEDTCNERGHEILHKNSMSTRLSFYLYSMAHKMLRRVDKIYVHYAKKHEQLCRPVVVEKLKSMVKELNPNTYRKVLGLTGARLLKPSEFSKSFEELKEKEIDENFFTPSLAQLFEHKLASYRQDEGFDLHNIYIGDFDSHELIDYLRGISHDDPNSEFLNLQVDERAGHKYVDEAKVTQILMEYLFAPCHDYLESLSGIIRADLFDESVNRSHKKSAKNKAMSELTYHFVHYAYRSCKLLVRDEDAVFEGIKGAILPYRRDG